MVRTVGGLRELAKARKHFFPKASRKEQGSPSRSSRIRCTKDSTGNQRKGGSKQKVIEGLFKKVVWIRENQPQVTEGI